MSERSAWAVGYSMFAAVMLMMIGVFHFIAGLVGIVDDEFYVVTGKWVFEFDVTTWGWVHLIGGVLVVLAGLSVVKGTVRRPASSSSRLAGWPGTGTPRTQ